MGVVEIVNELVKVEGLRLHPSVSDGRLEALPMPKRSGLPKKKVGIVVNQRKHACILSTILGLLSLENFAPKDMLQSFEHHPRIPIACRGIEMVSWGKGSNGDEHCCDI